MKRLKKKNLSCSCQVFGSDVVTLKSRAQRVRCGTLYQVFLTSVSENCIELATVKAGESVTISGIWFSNELILSEFL